MLILLCVYKAIYNVVSFGTLSNLHSSSALNSYLSSKYEVSCLLLQPNKAFPGFHKPPHGYLLCFWTHLSQHSPLCYIITCVALPHSAFSHWAGIVFLSFFYLNFGDPAEYLAYERYSKNPWRMICSLPICLWLVILILCSCSSLREIL